MYKVSIFNSGVETVIHYPTADKNAPKILKGEYHSILSMPDSFTFALPIMNPGWGKIEGLNTKVKVINTDDNSVLFSGRVMPFKDGMEDTGVFDGEATCEGALGYLNDSQTRRWHYQNQTPAQILTDLLNRHNTTMDTDDSRKIQLGTVEITQPITIDTNHETTLNAIITKIKNVLGGDIQVRETDGILYLDYLTALGANNDIKIELGQNMKNITREYDPTDVVSDLIGLGYGEGINQLTISNIKNARYIRDWLNGNTVNAYGQWFEIEAFLNKANVALNKTVTASFTPNASHGALSNITDGSVDGSSDYVTTPADGNNYVCVDLGQVYELDTIKIYHYYQDGRTYHSNKTEVSADGVTWVTLFDSSVNGEYKETNQGHEIIGDDFVEDETAKSKYGTIEGLYTNAEIQDAYTLKLATKTALSNSNQPKLTLDSGMVDRSVLSQYALEKYTLGDTLHLLNAPLNLDVYARVTEVSFDILAPQDKTNVISTRPITLADETIQLKQRTASLENAPQGSTCIFPLCKAENADADHPITFDLDIPIEAININKVYINLHGRPYRAYEKDTAAGGGFTKSQTSQTTTSGGDHCHTIASFSGTSDAVTERQYYMKNSMNWDSGTTATVALKTSETGELYTDNVSTEHSHEVTIPAISIPNHTHPQTYGIYEGTYPKNIKISVNGQDIGASYGDGIAAIDQYNIDITKYVAIGNNKISISTEQNGRIDAIIYSQVFIQAK